VSYEEISQADADTGGSAEEFSLIRVSQFGTMLY